MGHCHRARSRQNAPLTAAAAAARQPRRISISDERSHTHNFPRPHGSHVIPRECKKLLLGWIGSRDQDHSCKKAGFLPRMEEPTKRLSVTLMKVETRCNNEITLSQDESIAMPQIKFMPA